MTSVEFKIVKLYMLHEELQKRKFYAKKNAVIYNIFTSNNFTSGVYFDNCILFLRVR